MPLYVHRIEEEKEEKDESDRLIHQRLLGCNLSHNRDKNFFSNSPQISPKHRRHSPLDSRLWMRGGVPFRIHRCILACIFSVNRWDLVGRSDRTEVSNPKQWASRAARSDASSKAFMALFRGSASLFIRISSFFFFPFLFAPLISFLFIATPLWLCSSSSSHPCQFPFPRIMIYTYYYTRCHAISKVRTNSSENSTFAILWWQCINYESSKCAITFCINTSYYWNNIVF